MNLLLRWKFADEQIVEPGDVRHEEVRELLFHEIKRAPNRLQESGVIAFMVVSLPLRSD